MEKHTKIKGYKKGLFADLKAFRIWIGNVSSDRLNLINSRISDDNLLGLDTIYIDDSIVDKILTIFDDKKLLEDNSVKALYHQLPLYLMKADLLRYVCIYLYGGLYADMSIKFKRIPNFKKYEIFLFVETYLDKKFINKTKNYNIRKIAYNQKIIQRLEETPVRIFSSIFCSYNYGHPFILDIIKCIFDRCNALLKHGLNEPYDAIFLTGPDVITSTFCDTLSKYKSRIYIFNKRVTFKYIDWIRNDKTISNWRNLIINKKK